MKKILILFIALIFLRIVNAQTIPQLTDSDMIQNTDIKKKAGWIKIGFDSSFNFAENSSSIKYILYDFCDLKGRYLSNYSKKPGLAKNKFEIDYKPENIGSNSNLLNGILVFYNKKNMKTEYLIKEGFILKICEYNARGKLKNVYEFIPSNSKVELYGNHYDKTGTFIKYDSHGIHDEKGNVDVPGSKNIALIER